ncbi:MATE family efflux transporter [Anaerovorax odorimutans]|uniref:MATE family efflux transporter n=1 Tax=Anaerovorax odorimutans TaxID=109327 RepID=UPI0004154703|nr:MATE family efflux transporter [Anaerovorax odorimutans]
MDEINNVKLETEKEGLQLNKMGIMPVGKLLFTMSLPAMVSMIIQALYNIVDSIFVGHINETALAAVTLIFPIQLLLIAVGVGTGVGLNSLISRRLGEQKYDEANSAASHGILLAFVNWIFFAIFGIFFSEVFIKAFSDSPQIIDYAIDYCKVVTIFSLFIFIELNIEKILQATGNMISPMISNMVGAITNIILDPILIFGLLGAPKLGVLGAAIATVIGQFVSMVIGLMLLFLIKNEVHVSYKNFKISWGTISNIYSVGLPAIIMQAIASVMIGGLNIILISFSEAAVAVLGAYFRLQSFIFMPVFGLMQGTMPILGYNFGARNKERLIHAYKLALITSLIIMFIGVIVFQLFPASLLNLFNASSDMIEIGVRALRIISTCFIFAAFGIITATLFQATGHGLLSLIVSLLRQLILILPLSYALSYFYGLDYVWLGFPLAEIFSTITIAIFLKHIYNKEIKNLDSV